MTAARKTILVVDDNAINRKVLHHILSDSYAVEEAENGEEALERLFAHRMRFAAVLLDLVMPKMDGYTFLSRLAEDACFRDLPVIVTTGNCDAENEIRALQCGAWDFISKPYHAEIIRCRLENALARSQLQSFQMLKRRAEVDTLTGIYNKNALFDATEEMLLANPITPFALLHIDIDRFQLINAFFGDKQGDLLLQYLARWLREFAREQALMTYGRIAGDVFGVCLPCGKPLDELIAGVRKALIDCSPVYNVVPTVGIYRLEDTSLPVSEMMDRAALAARKCKAAYVDYYAFYDEALSREIIWEQEITNDMNAALEQEHFALYWQPQYDLQTQTVIGAEVNVRWNHPNKGQLLPKDFIPIFERNGFIIQMDAYIWERACRYIRQWLDDGLRPLPVSVNISRVNLHNPRLVENLIQLVETYGIDPALLNLEITESAYTDDPEAMLDMVAQLQKYGFLVMMDDFGSGYSSLNMLKDIAVDVIKLDMNFLSSCKAPERSEKILSSVVEMARQLDILTIAEGVETPEQMAILNRIRCRFAQGYYLAKPMPAADYAALLQKRL